ncbi:ent-kaur-16-ene synthase, chloroplastic-like [Triticum dicoccoides]|uniref:ent-kaur-16-ene synthase, chloroplastic-like n=1 Tax=Triticum dicoccoides TaxID=85692 RepID=UPI00189046F7|nr:ent-kaur-16-ene synthase, chloroplastic-like [Triticum dicoccoides]
MAAGADAQGKVILWAERESGEEDEDEVERKARIRKQLLEPELLPSSYDTAWVAMVPLRGSPQVPCFPQCVECVLQNQQSNGSWGLVQMDSSVNKDVLSSTLACVLALKRGLRFIGRNFSIVTNEQSVAPIGFNITFSGMLSLGMEMGLEFPVGQNELDRILHLREVELKRFVGDKSDGRKAYMAYVAEGLGNLLDWNQVMKFQRKNGSLFNSPSTTAAALIHNFDDKALQYLNLLVSKFGGSVYPTNIHCQLSLVDSLENIGISQHFSSEIKRILDVAYSFWLQRDKEIMLDVAACAMAFRLLRMNGYDVSSDDLYHVGESTFHNSLQGYLNDTKSILELYKASKVSVSEKEFILDNIGYWSDRLLTEKSFSDRVQTTPIFQEVEYALKFPFYARVERIGHKRNIEHFDAMWYFNVSQSIYQDELLHLESWVKGNRLDQLQFARQKLTYCYLAAAATIFPPELSDARMSWAKNGVLTTVVDDFFDVGGSKEEHENLITLVEKWDDHPKDEFRSKQVKILFYAIYTIVNQLGAVDSAIQNRDVRKHLIELWLQLLRSMMSEAEWRMRKYVPTVEQYMSNAVVSFTLGPIVLTSLYFIGPKLSGCVVQDQEYNELFRLTSTIGRLLNDIQGLERESREGNLDYVSLLVLHSGGSMSIETAKEMIQKAIASCRKGLLKLVLRENTVVPRPCKELFWKMCKIVHLFYSQTDGFSSPNEMVSTVHAVITEPLKLQINNPPLPVQSEN